MRRYLTPPALTAFAVVLALFIGMIAPVAAQTEPESDSDGKKARPTKGIKAKQALAVHHGPVVVTLSDTASDGHQLGDLRVTSVATTTEDGEPLGRLDATLTTTSVDVPAEGDEIRTSTLVFSFGEDGVSQIVVGGVAEYPAQGATIAIGDTTTRAIIGGSGRFAGATGDAVTQHLGGDDWVHWLDVGKSKSKPKADDLDKLFDSELKERAKVRIAEFKDQRKARQEERRAQAKERRETRKAERAGGSSVDAGIESEAATEEVGITRTDLGIASPETAPGETLGLWHYAIPAGSELVPHTHPGWQIARIAQGELEYQIISGEGTLIHADGSSELVGPGSYTLRAGDSIVENPDLEHFGANRTDEVVTILAATLYEEGAALAIPIEPVG